MSHFLTGGFLCDGWKVTPKWSDDQIGFTEIIKHRLVSATEFKTNCLALLDEVEEQGGTITVTKRGRPVATVSRIKAKPGKSTKGILARKGKIAGDIANFHMDWNVLRDAEDPE
jgi:prevent-host-death family protein